MGNAVPSGVWMCFALQFAGACPEASAWAAYGRGDVLEAGDCFAACVDQATARPHGGGMRRCTRWFDLPSAAAKSGTDLASWQCDGDVPWSPRGVVVCLTSSVFKL